MDTAPLPKVGDGVPGGDARRDGAPRPGGTPRRAPDMPPSRSTVVPDDGAAVRPPGRALRATEVVAGLLSGGLLLVGVALLVLQLLAPRLFPGSGLAAATGPGWGRVALHLAVGAAGEATVLLRRRCGVPIRAALAAAVIIGAVAVLWFGWWQ